LQDFLAGGIYRHSLPRGGSIARISQIATAGRTSEIRCLAGLSFSIRLLRSMRSLLSQPLLMAYDRSPCILLSGNIPLAYEDLLIGS
jgi:hypothetical protein